MLKYISHILGVLTGLAILVVGAFAPPAHAASANLVLTQIQAGGLGAATQELVVLYNNSPNDVNITNWCLKNKSAVKFACFTTGDDTKARFIPGYSFATVGSTALSTFLGIDFTLTYTSTNQSSGAIVGSSDAISLVDASGTVIDSQSWSTSLTSGMLFARKVATNEPFTYLDTDQPSDWQVQSPEFAPDNETVLRDLDPPIDGCPNIDGVQVVPPEDYILTGAGSCILSLPPLTITELLPNAAGADEGSEFIELYNSGDQPVD